MYKKHIKVPSFILILALVVSSFVYAAPVHKEIFNDVSADNIYSHIETLASVDDARMTGTEGERAAFDYVAEQLESYGLTVERQEFDIVNWFEHEGSLEMVSPEAKSFQTAIFQYSPSSPQEGVTAEVVYCNLGHPEDFTADVNGKIALIQRGEITFAEKVQNAADAGAVGVIIFNNRPGAVNGTLGDPGQIPAMECCRRTACTLRVFWTPGILSR
ncbi:MAG: PA domain-containing protein [Caulobacteraceae bacterium]